MHSSVLQNKKYMKFAGDSTVEVIAVSKLDQAIQKKDPKAGTYTGMEDGGKEVEYLISWPGLTVADMKALSRSKAPSYNDTRGIPYVAIVNPHTLEKFAGWNGGSSGKIMDAVKEAQKSLTKAHGKPIKRKTLNKIRKEEAKVRATLSTGDLGKAWTAYATLAKKVAKQPDAIKAIATKVQADLLVASEKKLTELEGLVARGETKAAAKELRGFARSLKGTPPEARAQALADKIKPPKS